LSTPPAEKELFPISYNSYVQSVEARRQHAAVRDQLRRRTAGGENPLPPLAYVRHSAVRFWDEYGKSCTDAFSARAKRSFPRVKSDTPAATIIHRLLWVCVVNSEIITGLLRARHDRLQAVRAGSFVDNGQRPQPGFKEMRKRQRGRLDRGSTRRRH
jgi:hypothetical protein